jgi:hypothetical protein
LAGLTTVVLLVLIVVGFVRGLEASLAASGDPDVVLVHTLGAGENIEYSSVAGSTADLLAASLSGIKRRCGVAYASGELYLGTKVGRGPGDAAAMGLVRGVTPGACLVRRQVQLLEGHWPGPGEVLAGRMAATKLGWMDDALAVGQSITFEGRTWKVSGRFAARGAVFESELWCPLEDMQQALKRQDLSLVAVMLEPGAGSREIELFCKTRLDLELQATREMEYFGRVRELATLQTVGFLRRAIALSLVQEATLLAMAGALVATVLALAAINGLAVRFTMGAFALRIDSVAVLLGCGSGLALGLIGALPPAVRAMRLPVVEGLKAI